MSEQPTAERTMETGSDGPPGPDMDGDVGPDRIMELGAAFWGSKTLLSAVELGVFTTLAAGPLDAEALRQRLGLHPRSARDFFDARVAVNMLDRRDDRDANTPETDVFLDRAKPTYVGGILEMFNARLYPFWGSLSRAAHRPAPERGQDRRQLLHRALPGPRAPRTVRARHDRRQPGRRPRHRRALPWARYRTVIDVGTAEGGLPVQLARAHPHLTGGGFDLPPLGPIFDRYVAGHGLADRLRFYPGDFFVDPLPAADVLVMGLILHDWGLEEKRLLLAKAHAALPEDGALIVYDNLIDDDRRHNAFGLLMSLNMLIETQEGFDYTGAECGAWLREAGFRETRVEHLVGPTAMVVGIK
ncbi:MAG: methyltransferase [Polyangiaceae bacterium]